MKAVIYARYSTDSQREESIEGQIRECREYAEHNDMTVVKTYIDRALSAKTDNRPQFQNMVKESAGGKFDVVLVWKLDRFARNRYDSAHYKAILRKNGVRVVSAKEAISDGPEGIILESMLEGYAEYYSAELSQKVTRGMTENALKARYNGGTLPFGYMIDEDKHYILNPTTAPVVEEIFTRYADGETIVDIINSLNGRGIKSGMGVAFTKSEVYDEYELLCSYSSYFFLQKQDLMRVCQIIFIKCKLDKKIKKLGNEKKKYSIHSIRTLRFHFIILHKSLV